MVNLNWLDIVLNEIGVVSAVCVSAGQQAGTYVPGQCWSLSKEDV